ncbi:MAG: hypothetical protein GEEBNDBF_02259 [bacterium]|nr:hypothetical protein [bacterium]
MLGIYLRLSLGTINSPGPLTPSAIIDLWHTN